MSFADEVVRRGIRLLKQRVAAPVEDACWALYGKMLKNPEIPRCPASCVFVCKGNICRSPFAERIARKVAGEKSLGEIRFLSAGLEVTSSLAPPVAAVLAAQLFGVALDNHRSARLTKEIVAQSGMIVVMEAGHLLLLRKANPERAGSIFLLPLFQAGVAPEEGNFNRFNIADPYGEDLDRFVECYDRITRCVRGLAEAVAGRKMPAP